MTNNKKCQQMLIHLHMPKTGGTTLKRIIRKNYSSAQTFDVYVDGNILHNSLTVLAQKDPFCIQGHFPFGVHRYFNIPSTYVTMLREPVNRVISEYYFIRNRPQHPLHQKVMKLTLEEYQNDPITHNLQTHYLIGGKFGQKITTNDLEQAKQNMLQRFSVVGITEMFDESLYLMKKKFGWSKTLYKKANVTKNKLSKREIQPELIEKMTKNNQYDIALYQFAQKLLQSKIHSLSPLSKNNRKRIRKK